MTTYTDVFGTDTVPPSDYGYVAVALASSAAFVWPYNSTGGNTMAKIMDVSPASAGLTFSFPAANQVSDGEDVLLRNVGAHTFTIADTGGNTLATLDAGVAKYFYLTDNSTEDGTWAVLTYGAGSSSVDAGALIGYGIKAISSSLNQSHPVVDSATTTTITDTHRAKVFNYTGGMGTLPLTAVATLGDDFFFLLRNSGTGTLTVDPNGAEQIDGGTSIDLQPGESTLLVTSGAAWFSVGLGRSMQYNFTQLVYDISSGTPFTLTAAEASNKMLKFIGTPSGAVTVIVPAVVAVYYVFNRASTAYSVTVKTASGAGSAVSQGQRAIVMCDGTDVVSAQSATVTTSLTLTDGSAVAPSVSFASQTNTGLFKSGTQDLGVTVDGVEVATFTDNGLQIPVGISGGTY